MKSSKKFPLLIAAGLMASASLLSFHTAADEPISSPPEDIEQIQVTGKKPLLYFQNEMRKQEEAFYSLLNAQVDNPELKVTCSFDQRSGSKGVSRLKEKVCLPNYVRNRMAEETQKALRNNDPIPSLEDVEQLLGKKREEALLEVASVVEKNPTLLKQLISMNQAKAEYEQKRQEAGFN